MKILICSGFFESQLPSYREYSYSSHLTKLGHDVTLMCGNQSQIWAHSRIKLDAPDPTLRDKDFVHETGVRLLRRHIFFRVSDFVLYFPKLQPIRDADVVHVIEFRLGITLLVALLGKLMGKPIVYDHEQRGDRSAKWYSRIDSRFRRVLIALGSLTVDCMRHTVLANLDHYRTCALRSTREVFAPLGVDPERFYFDDAERIAARTRMGIRDDETLVIVSGKLHVLKKIPEVICACRSVGMRLLLVGSLDDTVRRFVMEQGAPDVIVLNAVDASELRKLYNAADIVVFTTFTLSYWEALATGLFLVAPSTAFTKLALGDEPGVELFGNASMFAIPDEQYADGESIEHHLILALEAAKGRGRHVNLKFSAKEQTLKLERLYLDVIQTKSHR